MPPGQDMDDWLTYFRSGLWKLYFQLSREGRKRFYDEFLPLLHHTIDHVMGDRNANFYYLVYLGSKPSARGKGYAKKLIQHMTDRADRENCPTYLESSAEINLSYYRKMGFEWKTDILMERGRKPVKMQIMVREPRFGEEGSMAKDEVVIKMIEWVSEEWLDEIFLVGFVFLLLNWSLFLFTILGFVVAMATWLAFGVDKYVRILR